MTKEVVHTENGFVAAYPIELLARNPIVVDQAALVCALAKRLGRVEPTGQIPQPGTSQVAMFHLMDFPVQLKEGSIPAQLVLLMAGRKAQRTDAITQVLQQSWAFPAAAQVYEECGHMLLLSEMMATPLPHQVRRKIIANGMLALLEATRVDLIHWMPTQQMLSPADIVESYSNAEQLAKLQYGFLNVRFFKISNSKGDMLMDTLGLSALGLTDFQVQYRELEPGTVARLLYNLGGYVFEKGDVIANGHTVDGVDKKSQWKCRREKSLLDPQREVLDIDPGQPFAAGTRRY